MANSKYDLEYDDARVPQTRTARAEALEDEGPLLVAADHWAALILPNVWESAANGKKRVTMHASGSCASPMRRARECVWSRIGLEASCRVSVTSCE